MKSKHDNIILGLSFGAVVAFVGAFFVSLAALVTHIIVCLSAGNWGFLIAGALLPPIGVVHGIGLWFGFFQ